MPEQYVLIILLLPLVAYSIMKSEFLIRVVMGKIIENKRGEGVKKSQRIMLIFF
jgi:hypothetical protein